MRQPDDLDDMPMNETTVQVDTSEQQISAPMETDPVEQAAERFTNLLPYVRKIADASNSKGSLVRVIHALAAFPLEGRQPRLMSDNERQLFNIISELQGYKSTILQSILSKQLELEKQTKEKTNE